MIAVAKAERHPAGLAADDDAIKRRPKRRPNV